VPLRPAALDALRLPSRFVSSLLIVNPSASGVTEERLAVVRGALPPATEVLRTTQPGEGTALARAHEREVDAIYVFGGDGTFNEVLNGISVDVPLGFLPGGGTSVLPRALGLPRDPAAAATRIAAGRTRRIGLGRANGRRFGFNAGVGLDAELVRRVDRLGRSGDGRRPGDTAFARAAFGAVVRRRGRFEPALDVEGVGRAAFALVANCAPYTYVGRLGLAVAPEASFDAGLDLVAPVRLAPWSLPRFAWQAWRGAGGARMLVAHDVDRLVIRCDEPMPLQVDGEDLGDVETVVFDAERDAVTVLC
jgi:diacylglycerol kinase family enzyme